VVHLGIEKFHADGDAALFRFADNPLHADHTVFQTLFVAHSVSISGEHDDVGQAGIRASFDAFDHRRHKFFMILESVETVRNGGRAIRHRTGQAMSLNDGPVRRIEQLDGLQTEVATSAREIFKRNIAVTPLADGMMKTGSGGRGRHGSG